MVPDSIYQKVCESWQKGEKLWGNATNSYLRVGWWWDILLLQIIILCTINIIIVICLIFLNRAAEVMTTWWYLWGERRLRSRKRERRIERMKIKPFFFFSSSLSLIWRGSWIHECTCIHVWRDCLLVNLIWKKSLEFCNPGSRHRHRQCGKLTVMPRAKNSLSLTKIGVVWQKIGFLDQKPKFWAQKRGPLSQIHHVLATTGKSCSKKKSAFAQIIKGGNVILGDFLG